MIELNNENIEQFIVDIQRGITLFNFNGFDRKTNENIGDLIINIARAVSIYNVQAGEVGKEQEGRLTQLNQLIVGLLNYFWHQSKNGHPNDETMSSILEGNRYVAEYIAEFAGAGGDGGCSNITNAYQTVGEYIAKTNKFLRLQPLSITLELSVFLNQYTQAITNPFEVDAVKNFSALESSLKLEKSEYRIKVFSFSPNERKITVQNKCAGIMVNLVHSDLDSIEMKLPANTLSFSSKKTFTFDDNGNFILHDQYHHHGDLLKQFKYCQHSKEDTAAFLAIALNKYRNKEQIFEDFSNREVDEIIKNVILDLKGKSKKTDKTLTKVAPYAVVPTVAVIGWGTTVAVGTFFGPPGTGPLIFLAGLGTIGAAVISAKTADKADEWLHNRHNGAMSFNASNISQHGTFPKAPINGQKEDNITISENLFIPNSL